MIGAEEITEARAEGWKFGGISIVVCDTPVQPLSSIFPDVHVTFGNGAAYGEIFVEPGDRPGRLDLTCVWNVPIVVHAARYDDALPILERAILFSPSCASIAAEDISTRYQDGKAQAWET